MNNVVTILPLGCTRFTHLVKTFCLPKKTACDNTMNEGIFSDCGEQWNCARLCGPDSPYFIPVPADGKIMLQTNFNRSNNSTGWGEWINISLTDERGNEIAGIDALDYASRHLTARSTKHAYQTIEIDISLIPDEYQCFGFKITDGVSTVCTQIYKKQAEGCANLVEIEGVFTKFDCWNNYYGSPVGDYSGDNFSYSNKIYLKGIFRYYGGNTDLKENIIKEYFRFYPDERIAPFMMKYILNKILAAQTVIIDSVEYKNEGSGTFNPTGTGSSMFLPIMEFYSQCGSSGNGSTACD